MAGWALPKPPRASLPCVPPWAFVGLCPDHPLMRTPGWSRCDDLQLPLGRSHLKHSPELSSWGWDINTPQHRTATATEARAHGGVDAQLT